MELTQSEPLFAGPVRLKARRQRVTLLPAPDYGLVAYLAGTVATVIFMVAVHFLFDWLQLAIAIALSGMVITVSAAIRSLIQHRTNASVDWPSSSTEWQVSVKGRRQCVIDVSGAAIHMTRSQHDRKTYDIQLQQADRPGAPVVLRTSAPPREAAQLALSLRPHINVHYGRGASDAFEAIPPLSVGTITGNFTTRTIVAASASRTCLRPTLNTYTGALAFLAAGSFSAYFALAYPSPPKGQIGYFILLLVGVGFVFGGLVILADLLGTICIDFQQKTVTIRTAGSWFTRDHPVRIAFASIASIEVAKSIVRGTGSSLDSEVYEVHLKMSDPPGLRWLLLVEPTQSEAQAAARRVADMVQCEVTLSLDDGPVPSRP